MQLEADRLLPDDWRAATLVGRIWIDTPVPGPRTCVLREGALVDLSGLAPTLSQLFDLEDPARAVREHAGAQLCSLATALVRGQLPAPCDLQAVRAAGVTFATSLIERVIEETCARRRAGGRRNTRGAGRRAGWIADRYAAGLAGGRGSAQRFRRARAALRHDCGRNNWTAGSAEDGPHEQD